MRCMKEIFRNHPDDRTWPTVDIVRINPSTRKDNSGSQLTTICLAWSRDEVLRKSPTCLWIRSWDAQSNCHVHRLSAFVRDAKNSAITIAAITHSLTCRHRPYKLIATAAWAGHICGKEEKIRFVDRAIPMKGDSSGLTEYRQEFLYPLSFP